jgi:LPS sulfotransferase NodH
VTDEPAFTISRVMSLAAKALRRMSLIARHAVYKVLAVFGHDTFVRFIVLTRSRTGSNLLLSFLNSHPNIFAEGEIFARLHGADATARLRAAFGRQPRHVKAKGFKIFYYHPLDAKAEDLWNELERRADIRVIHLRRENTLRTLLSRKIAGMKDSWTGTRFDTADTGSKRVTMTAEELAEGFRQTREWEESAAKRFRLHPMLHVTYEELVRNPTRVHAELVNFLDAPPSSPSTALRQQNPERLRELISNYDELKQYFAGSQWEPYFED